MRTKNYLLPFLIFGFSLMLSVPVIAQRSNQPANTAIGLRFSSDFNYFQRGKETDLVDGWFSTAIFGVYHRWYTEGRGVEIGLNLNYKGGFNLPVITQDYGADDQDVRVATIEMDFKVGPRFGGFHPKIGYLLGYRLSNSGFLEAGSDMQINRINLQLPFGASMSFPTRFGSVGFGSYYKLGITNVMKNDGSVTGGIFNGGRQHAINFEIIVTYETGR